MVGSPSSPCESYQHHLYIHVGKAYHIRGLVINIFLSFLCISHSHNDVCWCRRRVVLSPTSVPWRGGVGARAPPRCMVWSWSSPNQVLSQLMRKREPQVLPSEGNNRSACRLSSIYLVNNDRLVIRSSTTAAAASSRPSAAGPAAGPPAGPGGGRRTAGTGPSPAGRARGGAPGGATAAGTLPSDDANCHPVGICAACATA